MPDSDVDVGWGFKPEITQREEAQRQMPLAKGPKEPEQPPQTQQVTPEEPKPAPMASGLGTIGGAPTDADSPAKPADTPAPQQQEAKSKVFTPDESDVKPAAKPKVFTPDASDVKAQPPAVPSPVPAPTPKPFTPEPSDIKAPPPAAKSPEQPQAAAPPVSMATREIAPQQPVEKEAAQPTQPTQEQKPQEQKPLVEAGDPQAQINELISQGFTPGEAQAIVAGNEPKTISGAPPKPKPEPQPQQPQQPSTAAAPEQPSGKAVVIAPADTVKAGRNDQVDARGLYAYLLYKFSKSSVLNHPPSDGAYWNIKTGSASEWAAFALAVAKQESDLYAKSTNLQDQGGSYGLFQFSQKGQPRYTNGEDQYDPQKSADAFVRCVEQLIGQKGKVSNLGVTFGSILRPEEAHQYIASATKLAAGGDDKLSSSGEGRRGGGPGGPGGPGGAGPGDVAFIPVIPTQRGGGHERREGATQLPTESAAGGTPVQPASGTSISASLPSVPLGMFMSAQGRKQPSAQAQQPSPEEEEDPLIAAMTSRGFTRTQALQYAQSLQNVAPGRAMQPQPPAAPTQALPAPAPTQPQAQPKALPAPAPAAPSAPAKGPELTLLQKQPEIAPRKVPAIVPAKGAKGPTSVAETMPWSATAREADRNAVVQSLVGMGLKKAHAQELVQNAQGNTAAEILQNALKAHGKGVAGVETRAPQAPAPPAPSKVVEMPGAAEHPVRQPSTATLLPRPGTEAARLTQPITIPAKTSEQPVKLREAIEQTPANSAPSPYVDSSGQRRSWADIPNGRAVQRQDGKIFTSGSHTVSAIQAEIQGPKATGEHKATSSGEVVNGVYYPFSRDVPFRGTSLDVAMVDLKRAEPLTEENFGGHSLVPKGWKAEPLPRAPEPEEPTQYTGAPAGSTRGVANPESFSQLTPGLKFAEAMKEHKELLSPDDPRVKKQADGKFKGEHFIEGDPVHDQALEGLRGGKEGMERQMIARAEKAIADDESMHISYLSSPKEAAKFPTRESRTVQYEAHTPEARLMGTTTGQLVGHSFLPVAVGVKPPERKGEPHESYIEGISTNVLANNFEHLNQKLATLGIKTPYKSLGQKFYNDVRGYFSNLNAGHTATGRGYAVGTEHHPVEPDASHVPYKLTRTEADFIGAAINNTAAFSRHEDAQKLRELARANGTLITEAGETNRLLHLIEQQDPGWSGRGSGKRGRVLEPSIRTFKTGLIVAHHAKEEHMPETIRPGKEYQELTRAIQSTRQQGRPDVPIAVSLHHTFADNRTINKIERDFSEHKIDEAEARRALQAMGEDPDEYRFHGGSGGLITPYEEDPEAITPEEHTQMKANLRDQWVNGKMDAEKYRQKAAEVPLPSKPSKAAPTPKPPAPSEPSEEAPEPTAPTPPSAPKPLISSEKPGISEAPSVAHKPEEPKPLGTHSYVSPNVEEGTKIKGALKQSASSEHQKARDFYQRVEDAGGGGGKTDPTVGSWEGTAEGSSLTKSPNDTLENVRLKSAIRGLHSVQKGVASFKHDPEGLDRLYDIDFPNAKHAQVDKLITEHQFPGHTVFTGPEGHLRAHLLDPGGSSYENAQKLAAKAGSRSPEYHHGHVAFDGGDTREEAAEAYRRIARESGIQTREPDGHPQLRRDPSQREHALQSLYEEAEDNYARLAREHGFGQPPAAPGAAAAPPPAKTQEEAAPSTGPPALGEGPVEAAKAKRGKKEQSPEDEAKELGAQTAAVDRETIDTPEDQRDQNTSIRLNKIGKAWAKKNPDIHAKSMHAHLTGKRTFPGKLKVEHIGEYYDANNPKLDYENEEHREQASDAVVHDIMHSLAGTTTGGKPSTAYGWYNRTIRKSLKKAAEIAPKILTDPDHELAWKLAWAITSQGQDVHPNTESTWAAYRHFVKTGRLPEDRKIFGGGIKAEAMEANFRKINKLWHGDPDKEGDEGLGTEGLRKMLMKRMTVGELKKKYPGLDVGGELAHHTVNGAMMLGAKIGAFFSNLNGDFEPTTMDLWFSRNMNLMAGNMFAFSDDAARKDRIEKGELKKSHLNQLRDALDSGMLTSVDEDQAKKMSGEISALMKVPEGKLDRPTARELAPTIYSWARDQHKVYQKSPGVEGSYDESFKTPENLIAKKLDEATSKLSDDPRTGRERELWRDIMQRAGNKLKALKVHLTNADKQALLWFVIKDLFKLAGSPQRPKADYLDATHTLVHKVNRGLLPRLEEEPETQPVQHFARGGYVPPEYREAASENMHPLGYRAALKLKDGEIVTGKWHDEAYMRAGSPRDSEVEAYGFAKPGGKGFLSMEQADKMLADKYALPKSPISPIPQHFQEGGLVMRAQPAGVVPRAELVSSGSAASTSPVVTGPATLPSGSSSLNVTHFGYPTDPWYDSASGRGEGTHIEHMQPGYDVALNKAGAKEVGATKPGQVFQYQGKEYRWGDNIPERYKDARMDVFDPYFGPQDVKGRPPYVFAYDEYEDGGPPAAPTKTQTFQEGGLVKSL